ncbi:hypothetical protein GCM10011352_09140 [Marinobacterium zhoushanense]|uniref:Oxidoreductase n=1 Tax=Marinobacterium zhoushanense TaxID=1679163 RepID=A0ABQ1K658_9GAMM|nr:DUF934 domain-containing protein [Marinobacterium zhoushanense]GGB85479.1 hypothetical protein GCM10011352_09140 [Marinobacterium zhoushanense]
MNNTIGLKNGVAVVLQEDPWCLVDDDQPLDGISSPIISFARWQALRETGEEGQLSYGVLLGPDDDPEAIAPWLDTLPLIALEFPSFRDGRAYTQANLLRTRYGYKGDLRATGDVLRDQLGLMRHCGFSSFAVREDRSVSEALKGLFGFDMIYARSVTNPEPLFRRRSAKS